MKDKSDDRTVDFISQKPKRGRPSTGRAMTPAQKQAAYREDINTLKRLIYNAAPSLDLDKSTIERLTEAVFQAAK